MISPSHGASMHEFTVLCARELDTWRRRTRQALETHVTQNATTRTLMLDPSSNIHDPGTYIKDLASHCVAIAISCIMLAEPLMDT